MYQLFYQTKIPWAPHQSRTAPQYWSVGPPEPGPGSGRAASNPLRRRFREPRGRGGGGGCRNWSRRLVGGGGSGGRAMGIPGPTGRCRNWIFSGRCGRCPIRSGSGGGGAPATCGGRASPAGSTSASRSPGYALCVFGPCGASFSTPSLLSR